MIRDPDSVCRSLLVVIVIMTDGSKKKKIKMRLSVELGISESAACRCHAQMKARQNSDQLVQVTAFNDPYTCM